MALRDLGRIRRVGALLKACREASGYASSRAFFDCAGGRSVLGFDYATYRRLEEKDRLPAPRTFKRIYEELENSCAPRFLRALARAYAECLLGEELSLWLPRCGPSRSGAQSGLVEMRAELWERVLSDPLGLTAVLALERGRVRAEDLPATARKARRTLRRLARLGLAREAGGVFLPARKAFPLARLTSDGAALFLRRLFQASDEGDAEWLGGATEFVTSDAEDMEEFFRHLWRSAAPGVLRARTKAGRGESVYLLEIKVRRPFELRRGA